MWLPGGRGDPAPSTLAVLLVRARAVRYTPSEEETALLRACDERAQNRGLGCGLAALLATQVALRRAGGPSFVAIAARTAAVLSAATLAGMLGSQTAAQPCLCDLLAAARWSPLGGEAAWLLRERAPTSRLLARAPPAWEDGLPRLPRPAAAGAAAAETSAREPAWQDADGDVGPLDGLLRPSANAGRDGRGV